jgi:hypothetical protein
MRTHAIKAGGALLALALTPAAVTAKPKPHPTKYCTPKKVGFDARGTFVSGAITQTAGADTKKHGDDRYSGQIVVDVKKGNHGAPKGEQTYSFDNARVRFHPKGHTTPVAGDRVTVHGKLTKVTGKKCDNTGVAATTVRQIEINAKRPKH